MATHAARTPAGSLPEPQPENRVARTRPGSDEPVGSRTTPLWLERQEFEVPPSWVQTRRLPVLTNSRSSLLCRSDSADGSIPVLDHNI